MPEEKFESEVKSLLKMKPQPHKEATAKTKSQSDDDQSSSKRPTSDRNSGDD